MDLSHGYCMVAVCLALTGQSDGVGVLPDLLNGALGESVMLKIDQSSQFVIISVAWRFILDNGTVIPILTSAVNTTTNPEYSPRIKFDKITGSLELSVLTPDDIGLYDVFFIPSSGHSQQGECNLQVYERVSSVTVTPNTTELLEFSSSVRMSCQVSNGTSLSYLWMNGSSEITVSSDRVQIGNTTLTILNVTRYDRGPYTCSVSNPINTQESAPLTLHPIYGPVSIQISVPVNPVEIGQMLNLFCSAESTPPADFTWMIGSQRIGSGAEYSKMAMLLDSGEYTCVAVNSITKLELRTVQLISITDNSSSQLSSGAIAGIAIAVILAVVLVGALIYRVHASRTSKRKEKFNVSERGTSNGGYIQDSALSTQNMNYADIGYLKKNQDGGVKMQNPDISTIYSEIRTPAAT